MKDTQNTPMVARLQKFRVWRKRKNFRSVGAKQKILSILKRKFSEADNRSDKSVLSKKRPKR
jgi:hypothetical protein